MNPIKTALARLSVTAAALLAAHSGPATAASLVYQISGTMTAQNALAGTVRDLAGFERTGAAIPFQARIEFDSAAPTFIHTNTPSLQIHAYDGAVKGIAVSIGGFDFQTTRSLFSAPRGSFDFGWSEATTDVMNAVSPAGLDQFVVETTDYSAVSIFPGPRQAAFNSYSKPINLVLAGKAYNSLSFRAADTRLQFSGFNLFDAPDIPASIRADSSVLAGFTLDMFAQFSGPNGAATSGKATFLAQQFNLSVTAVPEPGTWVLTLAGLLTIGGVVRRRGARPN